MNWKVSHIFQEIGIFDSKYRQVSWKASFSFQIGNSALSYINSQLNQYFSKSLLKLASETQNSTEVTSLQHFFTTVMLLLAKAD